LLAATALVFAGLLWFQSSSGMPSLAALGKQGAWFLPVVVFAAMLDSINPCAFSVLLITIAILMKMGKSKKKILQLGGLYIFGIFAVYILIGLGILNVLSFFGIPNFMARVGAVVIIAMGAIELLGEAFPGFPIELKIPDSAHARMAVQIEKATALAMLLLGVLVGLFEFPCTGGPYLVVLGLLHDGSTKFAGFGFLVLYNLIFVLPLVIILSIAADSKLFDKVQEWRKKEMKGARIWTGVAMILIGVLIFLL
jgi:cytochrome c biogenesis protein CcdA